MHEKRDVKYSGFDCLQGGDGTAVGILNGHEKSIMKLAFNQSGNFVLAICNVFVVLIDD